MGLDQEHCTALHVQHVAGLALRELLAQSPGDQAQAHEFSSQYLRSCFRASDRFSYHMLDDLHFNRLQQIFGSAHDISLVESLASQRGRARNSSQDMIELSTPNERLGRALTLVEAYADTYNKQVGSSGASAIFLVPGHFAVQDRGVIGSGLCLTAAFGMQLAKLVGKTVQPLTKGQSDAYVASPANYKASASGASISNDLTFALRDLESLVVGVKAAIGSYVSADQVAQAQRSIDVVVQSAVLPVQESASASPVAQLSQSQQLSVDVASVIQDIETLIAKADIVVTALQAQASEPRAQESRGEFLAAQDLKAEIDEFGGMDDFIRIQQELFDAFERRKGQVTGTHAAPFYNEAKSEVLARHAHAVTPSASS